MARFSDDNDRPWEQDASDDEAWKKAHDEWLHSGSSLSPDSDQWDEFRWEQFFQKMDKDGRRIVAYYEKYWNHPDRDLMVEEAMAMHLVREALRKRFPQTFRQVYFQEYLAAEATDMKITLTGFQSFLEAREKSLLQLPAYTLTRGFFREMEKYKSAFPRILHEDRLLDSLLSNSNYAFSKIAGGHVMGYHRYTLGANIALCKRSLNAMNRTVDGFALAKERGHFSERHDYYLDELLQEARNAIGVRIVDLRDRFYQENLT